MVEEITNRSSTGLRSNLAAVFAYILGWVSGLVFLLVEKEDEYVRFHAMQSLIFSLLVTVVFAFLSVLTRIASLVPVIGTVFIVLIALIEFLMGIGVLVVWLILMVKAYSGEHYKLPILGDIAEPNLKKP